MTSSKPRSVASTARRIWRTSYSSLTSRASLAASRRAAFSAAASSPPGRPFWERISWTIASIDASTSGTIDSDSWAPTSLARWSRSSSMWRTSMPSRWEASATVGRRPTHISP